VWSMPTSKVDATENSETSGMLALPKKN
jgi:hypothetical protein